MIARRVGLPFAAAPPLVGCVAGGLLHLVGTDLAREQVVHAALGADGVAVGPVRPLPLAFVGAAASAGHGLLLTGGREQDEAPVALWLDGHGNAVGLAELPPAPAATHWFTPVVADDRATVVWQTDEGGGSVVWTAALDLSRCGPPRALAPTPTNSALAVAGAAGGVVLATSGGGAVEVACLVDGVAVARVRLDETYASYVAVAANAVAWTARDRALRLVRLDGDLHPAAPPATLATAEGPTELRRVRLYAAADGRLAVAYQRVSRDPPPAPRLVEDLVGVVGADFVRLEPPAVALDAGGWLDSALVLVHGRTEAAVSVLHL